MRSFALLAAMAAMVFCSSDLMAQGCGCSGGNSYAAPMSYGTPVQYSASTATPMMTSYASQGCSGCYQTSMAPATYTASNASYNSGSGSSCCGGTYASSNSGCCDNNGCCSRRSCRRARRSCCSNNRCGQTYTAAPATNCCSQPVQSGCCGSNGGMVYGGGMVASGCGCNSGMMYGNGMMYGGQMMTSGCSDCVNNVPATMQNDGAIIENAAPVPTGDSELETENKVDTPPTPDDT